MTALAVICCHLLQRIVVERNTWGMVHDDDEEAEPELLTLDASLPAALRLDISTVGELGKGFAFSD